MLQIFSPKAPFDALVVGSGATGGWAAKKLSQAGMRVALLEAGRAITIEDFRRGCWSLKWRPDDLTPRIMHERPIQAKCYACCSANYSWFVDDIENPYTQLKPFYWIRQRILGGRSLSWARQSYRMSDLDFKAASHDGYGCDWPLSYSEMVPYYEEVERFVGITGATERVPQLPDSLFLPGKPMTRIEQTLRSAAKGKFERVVTQCRLACLRSATSPWTTIAAAQRTGRLTLITDAVVSHIIMKNGKAAGVGYVDRVTRQAREVRANVLVLCASTLESTRLLMNSGICSSNDALGKYLMDHIYGGGAAGIMLEAEPVGLPSLDSDGIYVVRFRNITEKMTKGFIRGYGYQGFSVRGGFDASYKWKIALNLWGECLARKDNYVEIDRERLDAWGIPTLKIHMEFGNNEKKLFSDAREQAAEMLEAAGARNVHFTGRPSVPGLCIHEVGTARMGNDPKTSVVNRYCQAHDVRNVFVTDGACWVSNGCQNPTLTMMAITARSCDYIIHEFARK
jgi:choline dehydrogenase-like flavoprotein